MAIDPPFGEAEQHRTVRAGLGDHRGQVGVALLEGREFLDRIRQSGAAFVEAHHGGEGRQATDEGAAGAVLPLHLQVRREPGNDHHARAMTEDLVSDVRPAPSGVASNRLLRHAAPDRRARVSWLVITWLVRDLIPAGTFVIPGPAGIPTLTSRSRASESA